MAQIEAACGEMRETGQCAAWFSNADDKVRQVRMYAVRIPCICVRNFAMQVAHEVNGPMLELLASEIDYHDAACIDSFRYGAPLFGVLPVSGNGIPVNLDEGYDPDVVRTGCSKRNEKVRVVCCDDKGHGSSVCVCRFWENSGRTSMVKS